MARARMALWIALLLPGAGAGQAPRLPEADFNPPGAAEWRASMGPEGQRIDLPPGYKVRFQERGAVQVLGGQGVLGPGIPYVLVQPFIGRPEESASAWLRREFLARLRGLPAFVLERFATRGPASAALRARYALGDIPRQMVVLATLHGRAGMAFVLSAPFQGFDQARNTLTRIAMSLRYGAPEEPADPLRGLAFEAWHDPMEGAFALDVPAGWTVEGGVARRGPLDRTLWATLAAPDKGVELSLNDRRNRLFLEPEPSLVAAGFHEGRWFSPAAGVRLHVIGCQPGARYFPGFLWPAAGKAEEWRILREEGLPGLAGKLAGLQPGQPPEAAAGWLLCASPEGREQWRGTFLAATGRWNGADGTRTWAPLATLGWQARPGREELADRLLRRVAASLRIDPGWAEAEGGFGQVGGAALCSAVRELATALEESWPARVGDLVRGLGPELPAGGHTDEATGDLFFPARGHNYYWRQIPSLAEGREEPDLDLTPLADL